MKRLLPILVAALSSVAACSDDQSDVDARTSQLALTEVAVASQSYVGQYRDATESGGSLTFDCPRGGTATVDGDVQVETNPVDIDIQTSVEYDGCASASGVTMQGVVDFSQVVEVDDEVLVETTVSGSIDFSGKIEADCTVDVAVVVDTDGKQVGVKGTVCGNEATAFSVDINPYWR